MGLGISGQRWGLVGLLVVAGLAVFVADPGGGLLGNLAGLALLGAAMLVGGLAAVGGRR